MSTHPPLHGLDEIKRGIDFTGRSLDSSVHENYTFRYTAVSALTCLTYDYMLTLGNEIRLVWSSRFSLVNLLYFLNRVAAFVSTFLEVYLLFIGTSNELCKGAFVATSLSEVIIILIGEFALCIRVYAIWGFSRAVFVLLALVYVSGSTALFYLVVVAVEKAGAETLRGLYGNGGCTVSLETNGIWIWFCIILFNETLTLALIVLKALRSNYTSFSRTLRMLIRDGVIYYICVVLLSTGNMAAIFLLNGSMRTVTMTIQAMLHSILYARFMLRLRKRFKIKPEGTELWSTSL